MVYQILEPLVMEKMLWENMRKCKHDLQLFCKEFEKTEHPSELLWETVKEHIKWYRFEIGNYIHLCKEGEMMSHEEKENSAADLDIGMDSGSIAPLDTLSVTPGGVTGVGKDGDVDPEKTGTAKTAKKDDTPLSRSQSLKKVSKDSKEKKEFSDKGTGPKNTGDSGSEVKSKKSKSQKKKTSIKKPTGKSSSHINSSTESKDDENDNNIDDDGDLLGPEEKLLP